MKNIALRESVRLRERLMPSGNTSLYLDIYTGGKRHYEYLKLYLKPELNRNDKKINRKTKKLAEAIYARKLLEIESKRYDTGNPGKQIPCANDTSDNTDFFTYYESLFKGSRKRNNWAVVLSHLRKYCPDSVCLSGIDKKWIKGFFSHLDSLELTDNSKATYLSSIMSAINTAVKEGLIQVNPIACYKRYYKITESCRAYLTIEELKKIASTPMQHTGIRNAFLFSCLTGLRKSDIINLTWGDIVTQGCLIRIIFKQQKTQRQEYLDITPQALEYMGKRGAPDEKVFKDFHYHGYVNYLLRVWAKRAGIGKHITFHTARHTFAVMMLDIGVDIYTTSKLLGHTNIKTTQIYAKILDKNKQAAVLKIPNITY